MEAETLRRIVEEALRNPWNFPWLVFVALGLLSASGGYFGAYLSQKGKNLADKEDIRDLTRRVDEVHHEFESLRQAKTFEQQLRMAAIDRRLETHQKALPLLRELSRAMNKKTELETAAKACREWWIGNCLYLEPAARLAFQEAFTAAFERHGTMITLGEMRPRNEEEERLFQKNMKETQDAIWAAFPVIESSIGLPALVEPVVKGDKDAPKA